VQNLVEIGRSRSPPETVHETAIAGIYAMPIACNKRWILAPAAPSDNVLHDLLLLAQLVLAVHKSGFEFTDSARSFVVHWRSEAMCTRCLCDARGLVASALTGA
jgi:hypothetical protein